MPFYCYSCDCGRAESLHQSIADRKAPLCPCGKKMKRDYRAEHSGIAGGSLPDMESMAASVLPDEVSEFNKRYAEDGCKWREDGMMVYNNRNARLRVAAKIGLHDMDEIKGRRAHDKH